MDNIDIAVRVHTRLKNEPKKGSKASGKAKTYDIPDYGRFITFDTETRNDSIQALTFGSFIIMNQGAIEKIGLFFNDKEVNESELKALDGYCKNDPTIKLYKLKDFVEEVFYPMVFDRGLICTAYNLPFDLSRIASGFGYANGWLKGGFTLKLCKGKKYPGIRVKHINSSEAIIQFQGTRYSKFKGNFIDSQKMAIILTDRKRISLREACQIFNKKHQKIEVEEHGKVSKSYIDYNLADTLATAELFTHLVEEYQKYGIKLPMTEIYSSATMGKAFLEDLGIIPFTDLNPFPPEINGKISQAYFGGRSECRKRKIPVKVSILDFTSQYPTLFLLLGLYDFLIAERINYVDDTKNTKKLLEDITLDDLRDPEVWKRLNVIVEIEPNDDLLPVRAEYNKDTFTVGLNNITSKSALYWGLPSIILSKLLTGRTPKIKSAIRFVPTGRQKTLKKAEILGMEIDPNKENIFKLLVEERHRRKKTGDVREKCIKIIANSTSYGIYMELNREDEKSDLVVYSGNEAFQEKKRFEKQGRFYNPIIATMITDGAKLLLGIGDCILSNHNEVVAYCDTDSMAVSSRYAEEIIEFFDSLNPYDNITHLLKTEEKDIWLYGISAKRYVLYDIDKKGNFIIKDAIGGENYSLHGLGHLSNPFGPKVQHWHKKIWLDILKLQYKKMTEDDFLSKYRNFYAVSQFTVSTASLMRRFGRLNRGKSYNKMIKPFNFFLIGFGNSNEIKPIAPFSKDAQEMSYNEFINYKTGKIMKGEKYFKSLADELWAYINHPESKLEGNTGILQRRHVTVDRIIYIGKEADKVEENLNGLGKIEYNVYNNPKVLMELLNLKWKDVKMCGISKKQFYRIRKRLREGKALHLHSKTLKKLRSL